MLSTGEGLGERDTPERWAGASEYLGLVFHGYSVTHLDALSHYFWDGHMYNGRPASAVRSTSGATVHAMAALPNGITTRGVLLDVARVRERRWLGRLSGRPRGRGAASGRARRAG
jgi:hypothetical protein